MATLIEDPWLTHTCEPNQLGCTFDWVDPDYSSQARDTLYYVRAIQEPSDAINANNLRCEYDNDGNCIKVNPCYGDYRSDKADDCLSSTEERAWSSPIYLQFAPNN